MTTECRAKRWKGTPCHVGPHAHHFFTYGGRWGNLYTGHCAGVTVSADVASTPMTDTDDDDLDLGVVPQLDAVHTLWQAFRHMYHLDHSNAALHCSAVRYSPLTFRLAEHLWVLDERPAEVRAVILDHGTYEEDRGR